MDKDLKRIFYIPIIVLAFCGLDALKNLIISIWRMIRMFFTVFGKTIIENYLTSPYFIAGVIMTICSCVGIYFGVKGGKKLYIIVSIIVLIIELSSVGTSFLK